MASVRFAMQAARPPGAAGGGEQREAQKEPQHTVAPRVSPLLVPSAERRSRTTAMDDWSTIDWAQDLDGRAQTELGVAAGRSDVRRSAARAWEDCKGWLAVLLIGVTTGCLAGLVDSASEWLGDLKQGVCRDYPWLSKGACCPGADSGTPSKLFHGSCPFWMTWSSIFRGGWPPRSVECASYITISVGYAVLCAWLVRTLAPYAAGSGIPEIKTILSGIQVPRFLGAWTLLLKCVGLCLSVGSGMSLGKEGPFVHVGCCVGNLWSSLFARYRRHESLRRELVSASAAAGVAVAFAAPIGGVLFSLEEASYYFPHKTMWRAFFCAMAGVMVLKSIDPSHRGRLVMFQVDFNHPWHWFELPAYLLLGVLGGITGALFNALNVRWVKYRKRSYLQHAPVAEVCIVAFVSAVVNWNVPYMRGGAVEFLAHLFQECRQDDREGLCESDSSLVLMRLFFAATFKFLLTIVTYGVRIPAGIFVPSLFIGACMGRIVGMWMKHFHAAMPNSYFFHECQGLPFNLCVIPGIYAIVGAAAVLGGVTRMTLSLVVIIFELTGRLEYLVPVMLAVIISKWVGEWVGSPKSIYEMHIEMNGYPYLDPKREVNVQATAAAVMTAGALRVVPAEGWSVRAIKDLLEGCDVQGFPVVQSTANWHLVGWISRSNIEAALERASRHGGLVGQDAQVLFHRREQSPGAPPGTPLWYPSEPPADQEGTQQPLLVYLDASAYIDPTPVQVAADMSVNRLLHMFKSLGLRSVLVSRHNKLQGIVTRKDLLDFLNQHDREEDRVAAAGSGGAVARPQRLLSDGAFGGLRALVRRPPTSPATTAPDSQYV